MSKNILLVIMIVCGICAVAMFIWFFILVLSKDKDIKVDENKQEDIKEDKEAVLETKEEEKVEVKTEATETKEEPAHEEVHVDEINVVEPKQEEIKEETKEEVMEVTPVVPEVKESNESELINVTINEKNYIFLANGNKVTEGEHIKLELNGKYYPAVIAKANYFRDISTMTNPPRNLVIVKE